MNQCFNGLLSTYCPDLEAFEVKLAQSDYQKLSLSELLGQLAALMPENATSSDES